MGSEEVMRNALEVAVEETQKILEEVQVEIMPLVIPLIDKISDIYDGDTDPMRTRMAAYMVASKFGGLFLGLSQDVPTAVMALNASMLGHAKDLREDDDE